jgi:HPt (histidine-containing phosphotransfer) domain-containing protein
MIDARLSFIMDSIYEFIEDSDSVMERLGGNRELLTKLLGKFHANYLNTRAELFDLLDRGEHDDAYRLVHSLKGVSANLGFGKLYRLSISLEGRMKGGEYDAKMPEVIAFVTEVELIVSETAPR